MSEFSTVPALTLLPAVDVSGGKAVRLTQGEAGTETNYGDPIDAAHEWADQGAEWIHLVDLDAAFGRGNNRAIIKKVVKTTPKRVNIELSGGIRDDASLEAALATGAKRINLGTDDIFVFRKIAISERAGKDSALLVPFFQWAGENAGVAKEAEELLKFG